jgi:hypothetical protein
MVAEDDAEDRTSSHLASEHREQILTRACRTEINEQSAQRVEKTEITWQRGTSSEQMWTKRMVKAERKG